MSDEIEDLEEETAEALEIVDSDQEHETNVQRYKRKRGTSKTRIRREQHSTMRNELKKQGKNRSQPPKASLRLTHVFGYRGYDCRNNLVMTSTGDLVYHVAAVGVVQKDQHSPQRFYIGHTDDILCIRLHPQKDYVATGQVGKNACIHVWDTETCKALAVLTAGHTVGVRAVDFARNGKQLLSVGLDNYHTIVLWDWRKGEKLADIRGHQDTIFDVAFNIHDSAKFVTVGVRHIKFWEINGSAITGKRGLFGKVAKMSTMYCAQYGNAVDICYTGSLGGDVYVWSANKLIRTVEAHKGAVNTLCALEVGFISGGKDGCVALWDESFEKCLKTYELSASKLDDHSQKLLLNDHPPVRAVCLGNSRIVVGTKNAEIFELQKNGDLQMLTQGHREGEVWGLGMNPVKRECCTVSDDSILRVWRFGPEKVGDQERFSLISIANLTGPARAVGYSADASKIAVGYKNGSVQILDVNNDFAVLHEFAHRKEEISDVKFSPSGNSKPELLAVGSHDNFVDIYDVNSGKRVGIGKAASSYITHVDWSEDGLLLAANSGDRELLYFEAPGGKHQPLEPTDVENEVPWHTKTGVLGPMYTGIWPPCSDVTDVNAACADSTHQLLATADDFGYVKLFNFPAKSKYAKCKSYMAHSAHVTNVRFSLDDHWLLTIGGNLVNSPHRRTTQGKMIREENHQ